jgi:hypothetical protein
MDFWFWIGVSAVAAFGAAASVWRARRQARAIADGNESLRDG